MISAKVSRMESDSDITFPPADRGRLELQNVPSLSLLGPREALRNCIEVVCPKVPPLRAWWVNVQCY